MRKILLLLTFFCIIQTTYSCTYFDHQFISMDDIGGGEFLFTFELCQGATDGNDSYTTGFLLDIPCLTITNVLTPTLLSTNGVEITSVFSGGTIEWGNINDQTLPHFIDNNGGGAQQCFTVQFHATMNSDCTDQGLIPYDFVAAWGAWSGSVYPENGQDHCWASGNIIIPCTGEQIEVIINEYWPWIGNEGYLEVIDSLGNQIQYLDNAMLANFYDFQTGNTGPVPVCTACGTYTINFVSVNQGNIPSLTVSNQNSTVESAPADEISLEFGTGISCCFMNVFESATDVVCPEICDGEIVLTSSNADGEVFYSIDGGTTISEIGTFSDLCAGSYEVMVIDSGGCLHTNTIVLTPTFPIVVIDNTDVITDCGVEEVTFVNNTVNATSFLWDFGNGDTSTEQNPTYTFLGPNSYEVILTAFNDQACSVLSTDTFNIDINGELIDASFDISSPNCNLTHIDINNTTTGSVSSLIWSMGNGDVFDQDITSYDYTNDGNFDITLNVANDLCNDFDSFTVPASVFYTISEDIKIPNVITPNSDELNKNFEIYFDDQINTLPEGTDIIDHLDVYSMKVYNRWGNLKFDSNEQLIKQWSAEDCADGVYYYIIEYQRTCSDEVVQVKSGNVTVLR